MHSFKVISIIHLYPASTNELWLKYQDIVHKECSYDEDINNKIYWRSLSDELSKVQKDKIMEFT